jgi:hypothetical protein
MKKISTFLLAAILAAPALHAQSEKYLKAMEAKVAAADTTATAEGWMALANDFERIADAEKTQWLPYYYAALGNVSQGFMISGGQAAGMAAKTDPLADKAEQLLNSAEALEKDNSDIWCVRKMIATLRMTADPMNRWQKFGPLSAEALAKAKALNPENPRTFLLEGQDKLYTPEQFGGSKSEAKVLFETAIRKFGTEKPVSSIHPHWGLHQANYFLGQTGN